MKIQLKKDKILKRWDSYGGFSTEDFTVLNSGGIVDVKEVPEVSKDLVEKAKSNKEINNGS